MLAFCHLELWGQTLTNAAPPPLQNASQSPAPAPASTTDNLSANSSSTLPDDPSQELLPIAQPEPTPPSGVPVEWEAGEQTRVGNTWTLTGEVVVHYRGYILRADKVVYDQSTTELDAEGHLQVDGGPNNVVIYADRGDMRLNLHTARYFSVHGSQGVRSVGRTTVYSTTNPFYFTARVMLENGEGHYEIIDGTITNCHFPKPDWEIISRSIKMVDNKASTDNARVKLLGVPLFYLPYFRHPTDDNGRESGFLFPYLPSNYSTIRGYTFGEQVYWVINRSMDMTVGTEYYSKRGWAPKGDFRYKGPDLDHLTVSWNVLMDRGFVPAPPPAPTAANCLPNPTSTGLVNQGGVDINAIGRKDLGPETRLAGNVEYLSCYVYRLVFNDIYSQAVNSEVQSNISLTHAHKGFVPSVFMERFQAFASTADGDEAKILHLPSLRFDVLDHPLGASMLNWGLGSSLGYLGRSEPGSAPGPHAVVGPSFHARNAGRIDFYPHLSLPLSAGGWNVLSEAALRETAYTISQVPTINGTPTISHDPLNRADFEASVDLRAPAVERDFTLTRWNRELRHVIEPELTYRYVTGIGKQAQNALLIDTTDIATNTNEVGFSLTQRFYLRPSDSQPCDGTAADSASKDCPLQPREWASWQIAQKLFIDPTFGGALISGRRNVFDSTLDFSGVAFLTSPRNLAPIISRLRFEAIDNLRIEWDLDYDPKAGRMDSDNLYAGYSWGRTTIGVDHAMLNAVDENNSSASLIKSQQVQPFFSIGKVGSNGLPTDAGFSFAANGGYDFVLGQLQYGELQATYNWDCCGLTFGYRRINLGAVRGNDTSYLYGITLANFGTIGNVHRTTSTFRDPTLPPAY
ncbi:MAG: LPS assembly protein LptD [Terracidiphilus sp.]